jgi:nucleoside-diphosphate-sugar epimerase
VLISSQAAGGPSLGGRPVCAGEDGRPVSSYGRSKLAGERELAAVAGLGYTILRPSSVYGPREKAIKDLFVAAARGLVPILAGGKPRVQLVFAADLARAVVAAVDRVPRGETLFAAHPEVLDYGQIARTLAGLRRPPARLVPVPAAMVRLAGSLAGLASRFSDGPPVFNGEKANEMLQEAWLCEVESAQEALGQPFTTAFAEGAQQTWAWYRTQGWL